jgi:acyl-coenzyme A thioesterase PaaI-like protein
MPKERAQLSLPTTLDGPYNAIRQLWDGLSGHRAGPRLFGILMSRHIPYTGSISPRVLELRPGFARVAMADRPRLRNHLHSLHAIALSNLAEYTGNLALAYSLPDGTRFIVKSLSIDYLKKARGRITGECHCPVPTSTERQEHDLKVVLRDDNGQQVATATLRTLVGPIAS